MNKHIEQVKKTIEPLRQEIIGHNVYQAIRDIEDLRIFMQYHVYAVWDFMSLLKVLQNNLTCTSIPWFPKGSAETRYLINEIVVGEESDVDSFGVRKSHFELYLEAMQQCGADISPIEHFLATLKKTNDLHAALTQAGAPKEVHDFVNCTFKVIEDGKDYVQAAVFTFGREDLIPGMFITMVNDLHENLPESVSIFKYYLERHIEVDGDHHSNLALQMTASLCGEDERLWREAEASIIDSLQKRITLWNGAYNQIISRKK